LHITIHVLNCIVFALLLRAYSRMTKQPNELIDDTTWHTMIAIAFFPTSSELFPLSSNIRSSANYTQPNRYPSKSNLNHDIHGEIWC